MSESLTFVTGLVANGTERQREITVRERRLLQLITSNRLLLQDFTTHIAADTFGENVGETLDIKTVRRIANFGANYALFLREAVFAPYWPENSTPEGFFADFLNGWIENSSAVSIGGLSLKQYLGEAE